MLGENYPLPLRHIDRDAALVNKLEAFRARAKSKDGSGSGVHRVFAIVDSETELRDAATGSMRALAQYIATRNSSPPLEADRQQTHVGSTVASGSVDKRWSFVEELVPACERDSRAIAAYRGRSRCACRTPVDFHLPPQEISARCRRLHGFGSKRAGRRLGVVHH